MSRRSRVGVVDIGTSNLASVTRVLGSLGAEVQTATRADRLGPIDRIVLPGVGSFATGMQRLVDGGWPERLRLAAADDTPILGICLGMQFLADVGLEHGTTAGLGFVRGEVVEMPAVGVRRPHTGWNSIHITQPDPLVDGVPDGSDVYFVHSYVFRPSDPSSVVVTCRHGESFAAVVRSGPVVGTQFHPEKSGPVGLRILANFVGSR